MGVLEELPEWAKWLARDEDGELWAYEYAPHKRDLTWYEPDGYLIEVYATNHKLGKIKWADEEPTSVEKLQGLQRMSDSFDLAVMNSSTVDPLAKYVADLTKELYAAQEQRLQRFLATHPELDITDLYFKGTVDNIEVRGSGEGDYVVTQVLPRIHIKPRTATVTGEMSSQAVQDMLSLYGNNKVKITIEVE